MKLATEFYWKPSYLLGEKPSLFERYLANTQWEQQSVKMSEPVMLPSIQGRGAKLGEGMGAIDLKPRCLTN